MKHRLLNVALILTSLIGYMEWGQTNSTFILLAELELVKKIFTDPLSVMHPFTIMPFVGQLILLITVFQKVPSKRLTYIGIICLSLLLVMIFAIGIMGLNVKTIASTLPFIIISIYTIISLKKSRKKSV